MPFCRISAASAKSTRPVLFGSNVLFFNSIQAYLDRARRLLHVSDRARVWFPCPI
ncbi:hypothetical protein Ngar_c24200 [Candidatus Nitrososphaera gargensis Ga9.2]|uniref:Uncharacterized protein n=1 Tax=Nitrososphaera gargensis (strain Ga9.2) TaxID=1237085 RepID=K0ING7_NITGG|nr:hypothetical protein Ngar_c24200 [Candidatus Nitrososphaera gargensis Ga9.2]